MHPLMTDHGPDGRRRNRWTPRRLTLAFAVIACSVAPAVHATTEGPAQTFYFSDCQDGAAADCKPGNNSSDGKSPARAKRTLASFDFNKLPAGSRLLFAQGGAWTQFNVQLQNDNATPAKPLVFDSYETPWGGNAKPWLRAGGAFFAFQFGAFNDMRVDGGYTIRNLKLDGMGAKGSWGFHLRNQTRNVLIENNEITGFELGIHSGNDGETGHTQLVVRGNLIHRNTNMGFLGDANGVLIENNTFAANNFSGSNFNHAIYFGGRGRDAVVRGNSFINNSTVDGVCTGGNVTVHGQWDGLLMEDNLIQQDASKGSCYGFSINSSYHSPEWFRRVVLRRNTIVNLGVCSICLTSAPGAIVEDNVIVNTQATYHIGIVIPDRRAADDDADDGEAIVRNNTIYYTRAAANSVGIIVRLGKNNRVASNLIYFGSASNPSHICFMHGDASNYAEFAANLCHHGVGKGDWSNQYRTLAQANAAGLDAGGGSGDPLFSEAPSAANRWRCRLRAQSPAVRTGGSPASSARSRPVGACEVDRP
jgi:hypothetical protein